MENCGQTFCCKLESLVLGQVYTAPVSIETTLVKWIINTKPNPYSTGVPRHKRHLNLLVDFDPPFDRGSRDRPILCQSINLITRTWAGLIFCTQEEICKSAEIAKNMGLRERDFQKLLACTKPDDQSVQFADLLVKVEHYPNVSRPKYQEFNGKEGNPVFYMFCLPATLRFPPSGKLNLCLPKKEDVTGGPSTLPNRCPSFVVGPTILKNICNYIPRARFFLEEIFKPSSSGEPDNGHARVTGSPQSDGCESENAMQIDRNEESYHKNHKNRKRKREDTGGESPQKRR